MKIISLESIRSISKYQIGGLVVIAGLACLTPRVAYAIADVVWMGQQSSPGVPIPGQTEGSFDEPTFWFDGFSSPPFFLPPNFSYLIDGGIPNVPSTLTYFGTVSSASEVEVLGDMRYPTTFGQFDVRDLA